MARHFSGLRLRASRQAAGISIEHLAVAIGRSAYSILEYQRGRVTPPVDVLFAIADALGCDVTELLDEETAHAA
ncbi:helix-turn-helix transcriptional regulator [Streptomyces sp. NPDC048577]|uniref:helix-turn-helix domain-containing protein n=1 Tax=Streptomyces sp. NPDC048577 TaxID=3157209 RepID=UPI003427BEE8